MADSQIERVTTDKPKNSGRVEWGKKLGKMQKELKAKKQNEMQEQKPDSVVKSNGFMKWKYGVAVAGLLIGLGALYYQKRSYEISRQMQPPSFAENSKVENRQARFSDF